MDVDVKKIAEDLGAFVGKEYVFSDKPTTLVYAKDVTPYNVEAHNMPYAVVRPASSQEVSKILRYASERGIPVHVHGSGTSLVGLARPKTNGIVLDTVRMNSIRFFPERGYFEAGPGLHIWQVRKELAKYNAMLPIFPGSELSSTFGGAVTVNTSAHAVDAALCKPGDYVLGLEIVLPNGDILETGTKATRKPAGIELTKFFVGSEGLLGVITMIRMRLIPMPYFRNIVGIYRSSDDILSRVMAMYRQSVPPPMFFEFLDEKSSKVGYEAVGLTPPAGAVALVSMHSWTKSGVDESAENFLKFLKEGDPIEARIVADDKEWNKIWSSRAEAGNYVYRLGWTFSSEITPSMDHLLDAYHDAKDLIKNLQSYKNPEFYSFGHIGAPTIHAYAFIPKEIELSNDVVKAIASEVNEKTEGLNVKYEGCGGEWGITAKRAMFIKERYGNKYYDLLVQLKKTVDPNNILNRGNLEGWK